MFKNRVEISRLSGVDVDVDVMQAVLNWMRW